MPNKVEDSKVDKEAQEICQNWNFRIPAQSKWR